MTTSVPAVVAFLTDPRLTTTDAFWTYRLHSLAAASMKPGAPVRWQKPAGQYNAFFLTLCAADDPATNQRVQLIGLPILIGETDAALAVDGRTVQATVTLNDDDLLTIQADDLLLDYQFAVELSGLPAGKPGEQGCNRLRGVVRSGSEIGPLMLCPETDKQWLTYRTCDQLTDMITLDRRYPGLTSFLIDAWRPSVGRHSTAMMPVS